MAVINSEKQNLSKISVEVISQIAAKATLNVPGVSKLNAAITNNLTRKISGKDNMAKGIKVSRDDEGFVIDISLSAVYGTKLPDLAWEVQSLVKEAVESIAQETVSKVNIHFQGVVFAPKEPQEG